MKWLTSGCLSIVAFLWPVHDRRIRKETPFDPSLYVDKMQQQRCFRCSAEYEEWDKQLHPSLFSFLEEYGNIDGLLTRYCQKCHVGEIYFLTENGISQFTWPITLDDLPPDDFPAEDVTIEVVTQQLTPDIDTPTKSRLEYRIFLDTITEGDTVRWFCSPTLHWQQMRGRAGYAIVRNDRTVAAIVTMLN